jgi:dihydroorotate dehydrogenase electron transfer subunit
MQANSNASVCESGRVGRGQHEASVRSNTALCRDHWRLTLGWAALAPTRAGQFIQVACRNLRQDYSPPAELDWEPGRAVGVLGQELMSPLALLRRPFSLAGRRDTDKGVELDLIYRVVGVGTRWLADLKPGDPVQIIGPLGNHFELPPEDHTAVLVGGGVGIPPMLYLASQLAGRRAVAICGATKADLLPLTLCGSADDAASPGQAVREFAQYGVASIITTDDGSAGRRGLVTEALETYLDAHRKQRQVVYTCGPEAMMKRVAAIAAQRGIACQVSVERAMACGMGTCQSCCIRVRKSDPLQPPLAGRDWAWRLACTDGPVFRGEDLLW